MEIQIIGDPPEGHFFLVSNHLSYMDIPAIRAVVKSGVFVAKGEIEKWFMINKLVADLGTIYINRAKRRDIVRAGAEIRNKLKANESVIIFPEGTSTKGETVLPFKSSLLELAAQANLPVSYASITYKVPDTNIKPSKSICWWANDTNMVIHLWRLFKVKRFTAIICFGDAPVRNTNRKKLSSELHNKVREIFTPVS